jgi:hypothetical protein
MQTLHFPPVGFRDLRAISLRRSLSRWRTPSGATRAGMGAAFALPNPPEPTCAVGWRPASRHLGGIPCPVAGAGLPRVPRLRAARIVGADPCRVCLWQTAYAIYQSPAHHKAEEIGGTHRQARASATMWAASDWPSFPLRPQPFGGRASGEKTADPAAHIGIWTGVSGGAPLHRSHQEAG